MCMVTPDEYMTSDYEPYIALAQAITMIAIEDYKKKQDNYNRDCLVYCLKRFYNFSRSEINNILERLNE